MSNYLIFCVEQYASDAAYPYLEQQQSILSQVVEQVVEDFPLFNYEEEIVFHRRPNCGAEYVGVRLYHDTPTDEQLNYLRTAQLWAYKVGEDGTPPRVVSYEVLSEPLFNERKASDYYYWDHDRSSEIVLAS